MRNATTATLAEEINELWEQCELTVDNFIDIYPHAFDITRLRKSGEDMYAAFHFVVSSTVMTAYYWASCNEWFVKA